MENFLYGLMAVCAIALCALMGMLMCRGLQMQDEINAEKQKQLDYVNRLHACLDRTGGHR